MGVAWAQKQVKGNKVEKAITSLKVNLPRERQANSTKTDCELQTKLQTFTLAP